MEGGDDVAADAEAGHRQDDRDEDGGDIGAHRGRPPRHDDRFTVGLVGDISEVLVRHGFPPLATRNDVLCFSNALHAIIYQEH